MNARHKNDHVLAIENIKKLATAIAEPTEDKYKILREVLGYLEREVTMPNFSQITAIPNINRSYLQGMVDTTAFDIKEFTRQLPMIKDARQYVRSISITNDPFSVINTMMGSPVIYRNEVDDETLRYWKKIYAGNIKQKLMDMKKYLDSLTKRNGVQLIKDAAKYTGIIVVVLGTIMMNYIICAIGLGLLMVDMSLSEYIKSESSNPANDSILGCKNYPYVTSGSYPLLHVDREVEHYEVMTSNNAFYLANNLVDLIKKIHMYTDTIAQIVTKAAIAIDPQSPDNPVKSCNTTFPFTDFAEMALKDGNPHLVRLTKDIILRVSRSCMDYNFKMDIRTQYRWCNQFLNCIQNFCYEVEWNRTALYDCGSVVQMFETVCLQIWEAFLNGNEIRKVTPVVNEYVKVDARDDTNSIQQMYNMIPPLSWGPTKAQALVNAISESVGVKPVVLTEATDQSGKEMQKTSAAFTKAITTAKTGAQQLGTKALPWCQQNAQSLKNLGRLFTNEDEATMKQYTYNLSNVKSAIDLLGSIDTFLRDEYLKTRDQKQVSINALIMKHFPSLKLDTSITTFPASRLISLITTGQPVDTVKETKISGQKLQAAYNSMVTMLTDKTLQTYFTSDIFDRLRKDVTGFQAATAQANKNPTQSPQNQPAQKNESFTDVDSILDTMFEADVQNGSNPPTTTAPKNPNNTPQTTQQKQQGNQTLPQVPTESKVVTSAIAANDVAVLNHAANIAVGVISALQSMTNDAYSVVAAFYPALTNREDASSQARQQ